MALSSGSVADDLAVVVDALCTFERPAGSTRIEQRIEIDHHPGHIDESIRHRISSEVGIADDGSATVDPESIGGATRVPRWPNRFVYFEACLCLFLFSFVWFSRTCKAMSAFPPVRI
jgi:hypothetical protein